MAGMGSVKFEKQSTGKGKFQAAVDEAKRQAREALAPTKENHKVGTGVSVKTELYEGAIDPSIRQPAELNTAAVANMYTGLIPARKRKLREMDTQQQPSFVAPPSIDTENTPHRVMPLHDRDRRPFAPPKKPQRIRTNPEEM